jgi:thiamine biosynthesis lipoprotein
VRAVDRRFEAMGCTIRLIIDGAAPRGSAPDRPASPEAAFEWARAFLLDFDRRLSRFRPHSELSQLNSARAERVPASPLLRDLVRAGVWAAVQSGGLVDPTLAGELAALGYARSWPFAATLPLEEALARAPRRQPARPRDPAGWRDIDVDDETRAVWRRPGLQIDSGGVGKGLAADTVAERLGHLPRVLVDCGGDIAVSGTRTADFPFEVCVRDPYGGSPLHTLHLARGAVATSGIDRRLWVADDGTVMHHLLDPATGRPAWTGLVAATAVGLTAVAAETLAKSALLAGPSAGISLLGKAGGLLVHDSGEIETADPAPVVRLRAAA